MARKLIDLTGKRFGSLVVRERYMKQMYGGNLCWYWIVDCDCGNFNYCAGADLRRKPRGTRSCGCLSYRLKEVTNG